MKTYEVTVGNLGTAYRGNSKKDAQAEFKYWVSQSQLPRGRASGEDVTYWEDNEPLIEFEGGSLKSFQTREESKQRDLSRPRGFRRNAPVMVWVNPDGNLYTVAITGYKGWRIYQIFPSGYEHIKTLSAFTPSAEWGKRIAVKNANRRVSQFIDREKSSPLRWTSDW